MAGYKETPRQKMIAMMYLVLTALLALNVSKEILDAFLVVNESIDVTNQKFARKIDETYVKFEQQFELNQEKVKDEWEDAKKVRAYTKSMINYIDSLKAEVIHFTEKEISFEEAKVIPLVEVKKKDNFDYPTNFFIGNDTKRGVASALQDSMNAYRERILKFIDEDIRDNYDNRLGLKTDGEYYNADGKEQSWAQHNFYHTILAATVTILNKIKAEVYNAESDVITYLYSSITEEDFKFSGLSAKVVAKSNYVFKGDDYEAEVLVAAVDETQNPVVYYLPNADTMTRDQIGNAERVEGEKGAVHLKLPASSTGSKKYAGLIEMTNPFGEKNYYHFKQEYLVAEPSATISPTKMNVFYRGVDNPVSISASGKADYQLDVRITQGKITRTDTGWVVNNLPDDAFETKISIYADDEGGQKKFMGEQVFRVKMLPNPLAMVIGANDDNKISRARLVSNPYLLCMLPDYVDFKYDFKVTSFTMIIPTRGGSQLITRAKAESMMFTQEMIDMINNSRSDDIIIFQDISVKGPEGPRKIKGINITIQ